MVNVDFDPRDSGPVDGHILSIFLSILDVHRLSYFCNTFVLYFASIAPCARPLCASLDLDYQSVHIHPMHAMSVSAQQ